MKSKHVAGALVIVVATLLGFRAAAAAPGETAPSKWETLLNRITTTGASANFGDEDSLSLGHLDPQDISRPHKAVYISEFGMMSGAKFIARSVSAVSEDWAINSAGNWVIDQVIYTASLSGELKSLYHAQIEENRRHDVLKSMMIPTGPLAAPEVQAMWQSDLAPWLTGQY